MKSHPGGPIETVRIVKRDVRIKRVVLVPGVHLGILGGGVPPSYPNRHPISAQKCHFSHQFSKLVSKIHTRFQTWPLGNYVIIS